MSPGPTSERPSKRQKLDASSAKPKSTKMNGKDRAQLQAKDNPRSRRLAAISASGIHSGDRGILITCDKGQEKKCLQEAFDLLSEYFEAEGSIPGNGASAAPDADSEVLPAAKASDELDIEAEIQAELEALKPAPADSGKPSAGLTLITLDIPCVSFVRFPTKSPLEPVDVVLRMCKSAAQKDSSAPRSRYIKRLTPVTLFRKTLSDGLEILCDEVLPPHFRVDPTSPPDESAETSDVQSVEPTMFAIRPTVRNNNKMDRDTVIRTVADKIGELGQRKHTVDLKAYDKLVLVDVYRNVVGMSVVGDEFEKLKKFNLAEIHAVHLSDNDGKKQ